MDIKDHFLIETFAALATARASWWQLDLNLEYACVAAMYGPLGPDTARVSFYFDFDNPGYGAGPETSAAGFVSKLGGPQFILDVRIGAGDGTVQAARLGWPSGLTGVGWVCDLLLPAVLQPLHGHREVSAW
mmetsp:Transcript_14462/g.31735  ORF Transcript_14462/g.31735 Transcript_14462/m.31735 type:complete len:131 (+) Transcript_14462:376-768(+)